MPPFLLAPAALMVNALVFGLSWWPFRQLQALGLHPMWTTSLTYLLVIVVLVLHQPNGWRVFFKHPGLLLLMVAAGMANVGFNWAVTVGDVVRAILLFYLMPAWAVLLAWPVLGEKPSAGSLFRLALALVGVVVVLKTPGSVWPVPSSAADWLALMGGFCFALTNVMLRKLQDVSGSARMLAMFGGGALMSTSAALLGMNLGVVSAPPPLALPWVLGVLAMSAVWLLANFALQYGASRLSSSTTCIIMLSEVVFATVSSVLMGAGTLTLNTLLGGALILLASLLAVLSFGKRR
jgi:drug/metabolite transporter (DMT)-like permease